MSELERVKVVKRQGDGVDEGYQVTGTRQTNPAVDLHDLPRIDLVCLSHYHA